MTFEPFRSVVLPKDEHGRPARPGNSPAPAAGGSPTESAHRQPSLHDVPVSDHVEEVVRPPSTVVNQEWIYAATDAAVESALGHNEPREVTIGPTRAPAPRGPQDPITPRSATVGPVPDLAMEPLPARGTREERGTPVPQRLADDGQLRNEGAPVDVSSTADVMGDTSRAVEPPVAPSPSPFGAETISIPLPRAEEEHSDTDDDAPSASERGARKSGGGNGNGSTPRVFVVAYDGALVGTYTSPKRIQNKTAYTKVAEQLVGRTENFDPAKIQLFKLTEIPNPEPPDDVSGGFTSFPREVPAP